MCTGIIIWLFIAAAVITLFGFAAMMLISEYAPGALNDGINAARVKYLSFLFRNKFGITALAIGCIVLGLVLIVIFYLSANTLSKTTPLIGVSLKTSLKNILLIILSVMIIGLQLAVFLIETYVIARIYTSGEEIIDKEKGNPFVTYEMGTK